MRDYANPVLLLVVMVVIGCCMTSDAGASGSWALALCATGVVVNGALAVARSMTHRPSLMSVVWAVVYLVLGSCVWVLCTVPGQEELGIYQEQVRAQQNPLDRDAEGETLLARAAALGKADDVRRMVNECSPGAELMAEAGLRAAEGNRVNVLEVLARRGMGADTQVNGVPLLHAAAQNGACDAMRWLIERGAQVNARDAEGATPLIHAVLSQKPAAVRLLLKYGAKPELRDASGALPVDYAKGEAMKELFSTPNP